MEGSRALRADTVLALLVLLPAAALSLPPPISLLANDPFPHLTGAAWTALLAIPALLAAGLGRRARPSAALLLPLVALALGLLARAAGRTTDTLEADRALLHLAAFAGLLVAATGLGDDGRRTLVRGLVLLSILLSGVALLGPLALEDPDRAGVLGNTGLLSQAALPGAAAGAWRFATRRGPWGALGLVAAGLFALHAALTPVLAGAAALVLALAASAVVSPYARRMPRVRGSLGGLAALTLLGTIAALGADRVAERGEGALAGPAPGPQVAGHTGGVAVRALLWGRVPALVLDGAEHALLGAGPGQTAAAFPPYRDPAEIERSTHQRRAAVDVEIDHVHSDWLQGFVDAGLLGGGAWVLFLLVAARTGLRALAASDARRAALGAVVIAVLVGAIAHEPLSINPVSMPLFAAALGAVAAGEGRSARAGRPLVLLLAAGLLAGIPASVGLLRHGLALTARTELVARYQVWAAGVEAGGDSAGSRTTDEAYWGEEGHLLDDALAARPDSVPAHLLLAAHLQAADLDDEAQYQEVLARRPHHVQATIALGVRAALRGDADRARSLFERALELDPGHPDAGYNLASLELSQGDAARGLSVARDLFARDRLDAEQAERLASNRVLMGSLDTGLALLSLAHPAVADAAPELLLAMGDRAAADGREVVADALTAAAHWRWARGHRAEDRVHDAVRSYRQANAHVRKHARGGAPALSAELAAACLLDGDPDEARQRMDGVTADDLQGAALPDWARQALGDAGLP